MVNPTFEYSALRTHVKEIRLLTLLPGSFEDSIRLQIRHVELTQPTERNVQRLSTAELQKTLPAGYYVFETNQYQFRYLFEKDDTEETSWSHPDESVDPVSYQPLLEIPGPDYEPAYEALSYTWGSVNDPETAYIVQLMSSIYRNARRVVIWLGLASANSRLAMSTLHYLGQQLEIDSEHIRYRSPDASEPDWFRSLCALFYDVETWQAIEELVHRDYFERLWIWQEASLANSRAIVLCGQDEIPWQILRKAVVCLRTKNQLPSITLRHRLSVVEPITYDRQNCTLKLLLITSRERKCADPRDHIYGIMSIAGPALSERIVPDYTKDTAQLFTEVARMYIETTNRLDVIACCDLSLPNPRRLASWVPDWNVPLHTHGLSTFMLASGISSSSVAFRENGALQAGGFTLAKVGQVSDRFPWDSRKIFHRLRSTKSCDAGDEYVTGGTVFDAFLRTLRAGYLDDIWPTLSAPTLEEWRDDFWECVVDGDETVLNDGEFIWCLNLVKGRTLIRSRAGHIGLGPPNTQPGDIICTLLGLQSQLMIRRCSSNTHQIVGECYLNGTDNCVSFLGPLPDGWIPFYDKRDSGYGAARKYRRPATGEVTEDDPRLPPLDGWERYYRESQPDDPGSFACFRNSATGEEVNADPRLTVESLKAMGLEVEEFCFV
ncbi:hypothetical protein M409DRAFT_69007 [Zasmidium cellare ATCC 36951]|uniref:WW domain-containing protein n=1 Tax=Zasmidium cellare ATCC 36951 TaxID=1080233 RepID=A0A6A6C6K8_ZASCE|nr:uncharacterized protein M409DRAFT_69007 [Zasmidium cellare ATCC 36951]KAF2162754.1 hypothetical protein M409DRAFT_69007 [Zasmidium cellare ATCC 36951]